MDRSESDEGRVVVRRAVVDDSRELARLVEPEHPSAAAGTTPPDAVDRAGLAITVRAFEVDDVDAALTLLEDVAGEGRWIGAELPLDRERRRQGWIEQLSDERSALLVAVVEPLGTIVGLLSVNVAGPGIAEFGMMVAGTARRRGVGAQLVSAAIAFARGTGAHKMMLQVWPHNDGARALYEKFGFVQEGYLCRHYRRGSGELWDVVQLGLVLDETSPGASRT